MSSDVLVVDPGELGELLATLFSQYGLTATCAKTGEQALELALRERPGAVVIEYDLHDADGLDVADLLREELGAKVVITYAHHHLSGDNRDELNARLNAVDASFSRPFRSRTLIERVAQLLGHGVDPPETSGEFVIMQVGSEEEPLLLDDEVQDATSYDDDEEDLVVDVDIRHLGDESAAGRDFVYEGSEKATAEEPRRAAPSASPVPDIDAHHATPTTGQREGVAVPISEISIERTKTGTRELAELLKKQRELQPLAPEHSSTAPASDGIQALAERQGRLTPRVLGDLLDAFHQSQTTGEVWLARGPAQRVILLVRGVIVGARTNVAGERLAYLLEKRGGAFADRLAVLREAHDAGRAADDDRTLEDDTLFKKLAIDSQLLDDNTLLRLLGEQTRRIVLGAFTWREGVYKVTLQGHGKRERRRVVMTVADAILRGALLTEPLEGLREAAPDDARFGPNPDAPYGLDQLTLSPEEARVVVAMDGTKTMADIATLHPEVAERTRRGLAAGLLRLELLRFAGKGHAEARRISFF